MNRNASPRRSSTRARGSEPVGEEAKLLTSEIRAWVRGNAAGLSIDKLLAHPVQSLLMCLHVARRMGGIDPETARQIAHSVRRIEQSKPEAIEKFNEICEFAMNGRKRGLFSVNGKKVRRAAAIGAEELHS